MPKHLLANIYIFFYFDAADADNFFSLFYFFFDFDAADDDNFFFVFLFFFVLLGPVLRRIGPTNTQERYIILCYFHIVAAE